MTGVYLKWRRKVRPRFFLTIAGIPVIVRWVFDNEILRPLPWVPFLLGAFLAVAISMANNLNTGFQKGAEYVESLTGNSQSTPSRILEF